jgi:hypothetical protein
MLLACAISAAAPAQASVVVSELPGAIERSQATFRHFGLPIYRARIFTKGGKPFDWSDDFALELSYMRDFSQKALVESTLNEFERIGTSLPIRSKLEACFQNVSKGDSFLAITKGQERIGFWLNGRRTCELSHPEIKYRFMEIFLGDDTQSQKFSTKLRGQ